MTSQTCYLCLQKMGACIQCGNRNCFQAFHVTCARRAKLYLKMKSTHAGPANFDASVLKALCDKHVPSEWRREHDVDRATAEAKTYFRRTMRGRRWADSQSSALSQVSTTPQLDSMDLIVDPAGMTDAPVKKRKQETPPKTCGVCLLVLRSSLMLCSPPSRLLCRGFVFASARNMSPRLASIGR